MGFLLTAIPGALLSFASGVVLLGVIVAVLQRPEMVVLLILVTIPFGILWGMWSELPSWLRSWAYRLLKRRRDRNERGND